MSLRLKHRAYRPDTTLTVLGTSFTLAMPESLTIDDINLHPISDSSSQLSFMPNTRKILIFWPSMTNYSLLDSQLLDEDGNPYRQSSQHNIPAAERDTLGVSDDHEFN